MSKFIYKLERKFGKYAIPNLMLYVVIVQAVGYIITYTKPELLFYLSLNPAAIITGQVWRLVTWVLVPEQYMNLFMAIISLYCFYSLGRALERALGSFYLNLFFLSGCIFSVIGAFIMTGIATGALMISTDLGMWQVLQLLAEGGLSLYAMYYLNLSLILAFAICFPDARFYVFFVIQIPAKVLGIIYACLQAATVIFAFMDGFAYGLITLVAVGASLLNVILFFLWTKRSRFKSPKEIKRQREYKVKMKRASAVSRHKCAICGQTNESNPDLQFRYCSKCEGNYEYCSEHLFTHEHVTK